MDLVIGLLVCHDWRWRQSCRCHFDGDEELW
jgi:hypothetical protein